MRNRWRGALAIATGVVAVLLGMTTLVIDNGDAQSMQTGYAAPAPKLRSRVIAAQIEKEWRADLQAGAVAEPTRHFASPPRSWLLARLRKAAARYGFHVVRFEMLQPRQAAPLIVVRSNAKRALARATPAIIRLLDPEAHSTTGRETFAYEGFLFKAVDGRGVPYLLTFNHWRGPGKSGGQWAADESLYPFAHG